MLRFACKFFLCLVPSNPLVSKKIRDSSDKFDNAELAQALDKLQEELNSGDEKSSEHCIYIRDNPESHQHCIDPESSCVDIFITFNEVHTLTDSSDDIHESCFVVLRCILNSLSSDPLFRSLFPPPARSHNLVSQVVKMLPVTSMMV